MIRIYFSALIIVTTLRLDTVDVEIFSGIKFCAWINCHGRLEYFMLLNIQITIVTPYCIHTYLKGCKFCKYFAKLYSLKNPYSAQIY